MSKVLIVGASSGIGAAIARTFSARGHELGLAARSVNKLEDLRKELKGPVVIGFVDISQKKDAQKHLKDIVEEMGGMDIIIINSGINFTSSDLDKEQAIVDVNVSGFLLAANFAHHYFKTQAKGHIVGISSIASLRGIAPSPTYSASKAFISNYLEGLRKKFYKKNLSIDVTDIRPGYVDTPMTRGQRGMFWVCSVDKAARQIYDAIKKKKKGRLCEPPMVSGCCYTKIYALVLLQKSVKKSP